MIRRAIGTTLVGLCALTGPLAASALADTAAPTPALTLSVTSVRQGIPFTINGASGCPTADGSQTVQFSYTDSAGLIFPLQSVQTADDGSWSDASVPLPVAGIDDSGTWQENGAANGLGRLDAICVTTADTPPDDPTNADPSDPGGDTSTDPTDTTDPGDGSSTDPSDPTDNGDGSGDSSETTTLTYASAALTVTGAAAQIAVSAVSPDGTVTVTPGEACAGTGVAAVDLSIVGIDDNASDQPITTGSATTSATGAWTPVALTVPDGLTGDYAVTATCSHDDVVTSSYDSQPLALGTVLLSKPVCAAHGAIARVSGSYTGTVKNAGKDLNLGLLKLAGDGPWDVRLQSSDTGQLLLAQTLTCPKPKFELNVPKTGVAPNGQVQARVCNTGQASTVALLQIVKGKHGVTIDQQTLSPGECTWLQGGGRMHRGDSAKAQVLIDPPGKGSTDTDVSQAFTVRRGKH